MMMMMMMMMMHIKPKHLKNEIIWSNVMSREKALIIGHEQPKDTEVLVNSLIHQYEN